MATAASQPNAEPQTGTLTFEEFLALSHENPHVEWVNGEVVPMSPVTERHADVKGFLYALLRCVADVRGLGIVRDEPYQMRAAPHLPSRAPDILFVAQANAARVKPLYLDGPADLVVEVVSPESRGRDRGEKFYEYEEGGVAEYWIIDPDRQQARFYQRAEDGTLAPAHADPDGVYVSREIEGFRLPVRWLWEVPTPSVPDALREMGIL